MNNFLRGFADELIKVAEFEAARETPRLDTEKGKDYLSLPEKDRNRYLINRESGSSGAVAKVLASKGVQNERVGYSPPSPPPVKPSPAPAPTPSIAKAPTPPPPRPEAPAPAQQASNGRSAMLSQAMRM